MKDRTKLILTAALAAGSLAFLPACDKQETIDAEEIAEGEGVADDDAKYEGVDLSEVTAELLLEGDEDIFDSIDLDRDELLDRDEFEDVYDRVDVYGAFDVNEDRKVGEEEFVATMFEAWDTDGSNFVGPAEYLTGAIRWFPEDTEELENYADIDADDDGLLSKAEFVGNMDDIALFDQWDLDDDADIAKDELTGALAKIWGLEKDTKLKRNQWARPTPEPGAMVAGITVIPAVEDPQKAWGERRPKAKSTGEDAKLGEAKQGDADEIVPMIVTGRAKVVKVISDRGFWLSTNESDAKIFAVVREDAPQHEMIDIDEGDELLLTGLVLDSDEQRQVVGPLEKDAEEVIESEPFFLSIYHKQVEIVKEGG